MRRIAAEIDFTLTRMPGFFRKFLAQPDRDFESMILASTVPEVGGRVNNFKYRVKQLAKLGISNFDLLVVVDGKTPEEISLNKRNACQLLGAQVVFDRDGEKVVLVAL